MLKHGLLSAVCCMSLTVCATSAWAQTVTVLYTTDIHGQVFDYDYVRQEECNFGLHKASTYIKSVRDTTKNVILLDNGDFLQGTPVTYFYNSVDTGSINVMARIFNYLKYDAVNIGNHDIETQHKVYDKIVKEIDCPVLGANVTNTVTKEPYFQPYVMLERAGKRIAVIGLTTPYVPHWLPEHYWSNMEFEDMIKSAEKWVRHVKKNEKPDAIIGLFHSGYDYNYGNQEEETEKNENASVLVAQRVEGFDAILIGHDHKLHNNKVKSPDGRMVPILDVGSNCRYLGVLTINFDKEGKPTCETRMIATANLANDSEYDQTFKPQSLAVKAYTRKVIGKLEKDVHSYESLAGSSAFVDMVHRTMLKHTGADISMSAPLLIDATLPAGDITVGRMFSLYRYENTLCVLRLTGREIKDYLEYNYDQWIQSPEKNDGHVLKTQRAGRMRSNYYGLDSAAGIIYEVDVTKAKGDRVHILSMADGTPFNQKKTYRVALNSYRANGGGGHLEFGAKIPFNKIKSRIVSHVDKDLRCLIIEDFAEGLEKGESINAEPLNNWKFVPKALVAPAMELDLPPFATVRQTR